MSPYPEGGEIIQEKPLRNFCHRKPLMHAESRARDDHTKANLGTLHVQGS